MSSPASHMSQVSFILRGHPELSSFSSMRRQHPGLRGKLPRPKCSRGAVYTVHTLLRLCRVHYKYTATRWKYIMANYYAVCSYFTFLLLHGWLPVICSIRLCAVRPYSGMGVLQYFPNMWTPPHGWSPASQSDMQQNVGEGWGWQMSGILQIKQLH